MRICSKHNEEMIQIGKDKRLKCQSCNREYQSKWYQENKELQKSRVQKASLEVEQRNSQFLLDYLYEHPCIDCGELDPIVLEFDHLQDKKDSVTRLAHRGNSIGRIQEEIDKCEVVCANCHRRRTAERGNHFRFRNQLSAGS